MKEYKYLSFIERGTATETKVFEVRNKLSATLLGYVKWYAAWQTSSIL
jgi:hypothetical protein